MGWRKPTRDDFSAALSDPEIRAFGQNDDADDRAIAQLIANTVATVRGYIRAGRRCRLSADETLLPDMLVAPAMDLAAWNLLKRFNRVPNDAPPGKARATSSTASPQAPSPRKTSARNPARPNPSVLSSTHVRAPSAAKTNMVSESSSPTARQTR